MKIYQLSFMTGAENLGKVLVKSEQSAAEILTMLGGIRATCGVAVLASVAYAPDDKALCDASIMIDPNSYSVIHATEVTEEEARACFDEGEFDAGV